MNVLMLCYYYPPLKDVGCKRSVAFSENFRKHGWNPFVISVSNPDKHYCLIGDDSPPEGVTVYYTMAIFNMYFFLGKLNGLLTKILRLAKVKLRRNYLFDVFCIPDIFIGWIPLTLIKAVRSINKHGIDVIYVSSSPFSSAIIGIIVKKITKKPIVVDFRDPFALSELSYIFQTPSWRAKLNRAIEAWIIKEADIFVVNTDEIKKAYMAQYPISKGKTYAVMNGFDFRYIIDDDLPKNCKFTIIYAGLFYVFDKRNEIYTDSFFGGLAVLKNKNIINKDNFQFLYFGDEREYIQQTGKQYLVEDLLVCSERRPYAEIIHLVKRSHMQLLRISKPMISTKLFEGLALNVPFLATIPTGEVQSIIREYSPASYVVTEQSPNQVADAILECKANYETGHLADNKTNDFKEKFSRESLSLLMMKIMSSKLNKENKSEFVSKGNLWK